MNTCLLEKSLNQNNTDSPIITSLLDLDFYKLTMGQFVFNRYRDIPVKYGFRNRTNVKLAEIINETDLRNELDSVRDLSLKTDERSYLASLQNNGRQMFSNEYLNFLENLQIPNYSLSKNNGNFEIEFSGKWSKAIYWETFVLSIVNELYYKKLTSDYSFDEQKDLYHTGKNNLNNKISLLEENPDIRFIEFGTRRRFSKDWQDYVVKKLKNNIPDQIIGTSNVNLAKKYNLNPSGTMAHELFMVMSGIMHKNDDEIRASHNQVLTEWYDEYGKKLSIALTDTYGTEFFFKDITKKQAEEYIGLRQDSGDPILFGKKQLDFYKNKNIDPKNKLLVPSDGLTIESILDIQNEFREKIPTAYGWGTSLTNDLGLKPLSIVVKAIESCGYGTVKIPDNPAKATGKKEDIQRFMKIFSYDPNKYTFERCKY